MLHAEVGRAVERCTTLAMAPARVGGDLTFMVAGILTRARWPVMTFAVLRMVTSVAELRAVATLVEERSTARLVEERPAAIQVEARRMVRSAEVLRAVTLVPAPHTET